jgi:hypothetical protein
MGMGSHHITDATATARAAAKPEREFMGECSNTQAANGQQKKQARSCSNPATKPGELLLPYVQIPVHRQGKRPVIIPIFATLRHKWERKQNRRDLQDCKGCRYGMF